MPNPPGIFQTTRAMIFGMSNLKRTICRIAHVSIIVKFCVLRNSWFINFKTFDSFTIGDFLFYLLSYDI